jgi:hypothetical protein
LHCDDSISSYMDKNSTPLSNRLPQKQASLDNAWRTGLLPTEQLIRNGKDEDMRFDLHRCFSCRQFNSPNNLSTQGTYCFCVEKEGQCKRDSSKNYCHLGMLDCHEYFFIVEHKVLIMKCLVLLFEQCRVWLTDLTDLELENDSRVSHNQIEHNMGWWWTSLWLDKKCYWLIIVLAFNKKWSIWWKQSSFMVAFLRKPTRQGKYCWLISFSEVFCPQTWFSFQSLKPPILIRTVFISDNSPTTWTLLKKISPSSPNQKVGLWINMGHVTSYCFRQSVCFDFIKKLLESMILISNHPFFILWASKLLLLFSLLSLHALKLNLSPTR